MYLHHTNLFAPGPEVIYYLFNCLGYRAHGYDDVFCLRIAIVAERPVVPSGELGNLLHIVGNNVRYGIIEGVASLSCLEENIGILGRSPCNRALRIEGSVPEFLNGLPVQQFGKVIVVQHFDLLDFVGGPETVKEMQERHPALNGGKVRYTAKVHNFLDAA